MANILDPTYDPRQDSGTSGAETSDLKPGSDYNIDLRYGDNDEDIYKRRADAPTLTPGSWPERPSYTNEGDVVNQKRAEKFIKSAKAAGRFQIASSLREYTNKGKTPRNPGYMNASSFGPAYGALETPSMGTSGGKSGSTDYADKPKPFAGKSYSWQDGFS